MCKSPLIVLKFGGSVLLDEQRLRIAAHEIYRWKREGWRVIAIVSAFANRTQELIDRSSSLCPDRNAHAAHISIGETESASLLGIQLDRAGIPSIVLSPGSIDLVAHGDPLDAIPCAVNTKRLNSALDDLGVVVIPGFTGINESGAAVTFGRGGSDLSAVFLSAQLGADRCRLIKDVDGLYESDPALNPDARRYHSASYHDAFQTDGSIIQHKAIQYAQEHSIEFEISKFNSINPTTINQHPSTISCSLQNTSPTTIAICGLGTVGGGVLELVEQLPEYFQIIGIACNSPDKHRDRVGQRYQLTNDALSLASSGADVVLELIGGVDYAKTIVESALNNQSHVITANKALIAEHGSELRESAQQSNNSILYSASVGGSVPILELVQSCVSDRVQVLSASGVLNGTGNYVLNEIAHGISLDNAIRSAQLKGYAESDPSRDLDGIDSLDKLMVIAQELGWEIRKENQQTQSISAWYRDFDTVRIGFETSSKQIARLSNVQASVEVIDTTHHTVHTDLQDLPGVWNALVLELEDGETRSVKGKGAGRWPTSESVLADLLELRRSIECKNIQREVACVS